MWSRRSKQVGEGRSSALKRAFTWKNPTFQDYYQPIDTVQRLQLSWDASIIKAEQSFQGVSHPENKQKNKKTLPQVDAI